MSSFLDMYRLNLDEVKAVKEWDVCFIGSSSDERGKKAIEMCRNISHEIVVVSYNIDGQFLTFGGKVVQCHDLVKKLDAKSYGSVFFEATTLGVAELALLLNAYAPYKGLKARVSYVEPGKYKRRDPSTSSDRDFQLSERLIGYEGIPTLARELDTNTVNRVVFFVGFESARLTRAFEEQPISPSHSSLVFGVPPYKAGWEANSYHNNIRCLSENDLKNRLYYCAADNPQAVIDKLEEIKGSLDEDEELFVAPIGSKPHGIGATIFQSLHSETVGLLYDHPVKSPNRSEGYGPLHFFDFPG